MLVVCFFSISFVSVFNFSLIRLSEIDSFMHSESVSSGSSSVKISFAEDEGTVEKTWFNPFISPDDMI